MKKILKTGLILGLMNFSVNSFTMSTEESKKIVANQEEAKENTRRLGQAIVNNNVDEVKNLLQLQNINLNENIENVFYQKQPENFGFYNVYISGTPLSLAIGRNNKEILEILLSDPRIDINAQDNFNESALMKFIYDDNKEFSEILLNLGADVNLHASNGRTALHIIISNLTYASENDHPESQERKDKLEILNLLIERGADINSQDKAGNTPLFDTGKGIISLIKYPSSPNRELNEYQKINLHKLVNILLFAGANPCIKNNKNESFMDLVNKNSVLRKVFDDFKENYLNRLKAHLLAQDYPLNTVKNIILDYLMKLECKKQKGTMVEMPEEKED